MKIIKVTSLENKSSVYINVEQIGHFYRVGKEIQYGRGKGVEHTKLAVTTHNNGGLTITETPEELIEMISQYNK